MVKTTAYFVPFLLVLLFQSQADAAVKTYKISGSTADELISEMESKGEGGGWGHTQHTWKYPNFPLKQVGDKVKVASLKISHEVVITMPSWTGYNAASACIKMSWDKMYKSLRNHEDHHVKLGEGVAENIKAAILAIEPQASAEELSAEAKATLDRLVKENDAVQAEFDEKTDHGKNDPNDKVILDACP